MKKKCTISMGVLSHLSGDLKEGEISYRCRVEKILFSVRKWPGFQPEVRAENWPL